MKRKDVKIYASKSITRYIRRETGKCFVKSGLNIKCVENGVIAVGPLADSFGVFDKNGVFVKQSLSPLFGRKIGQLLPPAGAMENSLYLDYDAVYLGNICNAFGHFLLEHLNRAYAFLDKKYSGAKFVFTNDRRIEPIPPFIMVLARLLGISTGEGGDLIILNQTTRFRNVYVPEPGFKTNEFSSKEFGEIYAEISNNVKMNESFDKIYVSRSALKTRKTYGEEKIQEIFQKNGYHVVYPEQISLEEQIALMKGCKSLAGCAGTALHLALFMPSGGTVIQIKRNSLPADNCDIQYLITETKEHDFVVIEASIEKIKTTHFDFLAQIIGVSEYMKRFFDDNGFKYSPNDIERDKESWDEYISAMEKIKTQRREKYGKSDFEIWILQRIVKLISAFIPNRTRRTSFRRRMKKVFNI